MNHHWAMSLIPSSWSAKIAFIWAAFEFVFYLYFRFYIYPSVNRPKKQQKELFNSKIELFYRTLDYLTVIKYDSQKYFRGWFNHCDFNAIKSHNLYSLLTWVCYGISYNDINKKQLSFIINLGKKVCKLLQLDVEDGFNPNITHAKLNLEEVTYYHKPLLYYSVLLAMDWYSCWNFLVRKKGFKLGKNNGSIYWYKIVPNSVKSPICIVHGISYGWKFYFQLIDEVADGSRSVFLLEHRNVALHSLHFHVHTPLEFNDYFLGVLDTHSIQDKVTVISHSWGTMIASWIVRLSPQRIKQFTMIDPIALNLMFPETTYVFVYQPPEQLLHHIINYLIRRELTISNTIFRNFAWYNNVILLDEIADHIGLLVCIAENDELTDSETAIELTDLFIQQRNELKLKNKRKKYGTVKKLVWRDFSHASILADALAVRDIAHAIDIEE